MRQIYRHLLIAIFCIISIQSFGHELFSKKDSTWARETMHKMNTKQKIAQLFMVDISCKTDQTSQKKSLQDIIKKQQVGGIIIMKSDYSLASEWIRDFQKISATPLMVAIDGEWGINMRVSSTTKFPYNLTLGAIDNDSLIYQMGKNIGRDCKRLGIHINFCPDADINNNSKNPVINYRSFGENKKRVADKSIALTLGMQSENVMACAKHFPGHGDTESDSHFDLPIINKSKSSLEDFELYPFQKLIESDIWGIMVAHLKVPSLDANKPTSLSKYVISDLLKKEMEYQGLVFSDALNMKGVTNNNIPGNLELEAFIAGNDILLMSANLEAGITKIETHVKYSPEYLKELEQRVFKILLFKSKLQVGKIQTEVTSPDESHNVELSEKLYKQSITFISSDKTINDTFIDKTKEGIFISISDNNTELKKWMEGNSKFVFAKIHKNAKQEDFNRMMDGAKIYPQIFIAYHDLSQNEKQNFGLTPQVIQFVQDINQLPNVTNLWFGNPYALKHFQAAKNIIVAYEDNPKSHRAVYDYLVHRHKIPGKLPVSVGKYKENSSYLNNKQITSIPDEIEILDKPTILTRIEDVCQHMIDEGAAPGCQIYVLHKGKEIYNKAFGRQTYSPSAPAVKMSDYYDLASVSKIMGTTMATMKLKESGKIDLSAKVGDYLDLDDSSTVKDITIQQLLTHEAGLTPFIPYYLRFNDSNFYQYFRSKPEGNFNTKVATNLFVRDDYKDTIWYETTHHKVSSPGKYKYSDLSMYIMQRIVERVSKMHLDEYLKSVYYTPMKLGLLYNPTHQIPISQIAPTELDLKFRLQQLQGYVHDQGCALYGGVCGHAGLFGTAKDVASMMQMLLNGGKYKGKQYIHPETITQFTSQYSPNSRRGLGFDKPNVDDLSSTPTAKECSFATFGHTGFTGTCTWADPFNELVFVFLSNRVYPNAENRKLIKGQYRERLQSLFYQYIK